MTLADSLKAVYFRIEDGYYAIADFLEQKVKIPIYEWFVNPIENRGIPSFPIALLIVLALAAIVGLLLLPPTTTVSATVFAAGQAQPGVISSLTVDGKLFATMRTTADGTVSFAGVPTGKTATLLVQKPGYAPFSESFDTGAEGKVLTVELQSVVPERSTLNVRLVEEDTGTAISEATVSYFDTESGAAPSSITDSSGLAKLSVPSNQVLAIKASKDGFEDRSFTANSSQGVITIRLRAKNTDPASLGNKGDVAVTVQDDQGNAVPARVYLYSTAKINPEGIQQTTTGDALFEHVVEEGTAVYVQVQPTGAAAEQFEAYDGTGDTQTVSSTRTIEFRVTMQRKGVQFGATHGTVALTVVDEAGAPISDAALTLFFTDSPDKPRLLARTDSSGKASFTIANNVNTYIAVSHDDYLPGCAGCDAALHAGDSKAITLTRAVIGNYGSAEITVTDEDGSAVSGVDTDLFTDAGFWLGAPRQVTDGNGIATFDFLPIGATLKARAAIDAREGESDVFTVPLGDPAAATIRLNPAQGTISVTLKDATTKTTVEGTVTAFENSQPGASCTTTSGSCSVQVRANTPITIRADASGYVSTNTEQILVGPKQTVQKTLPLVPAGLRNNLSIVSVDIQRNGVSAQAADRGVIYDAIVCANLPGDAQEAGIYLRAGDKQSEQEDFVAIQNPADAAPGSDSIVSAASFTPGSSCSVDYLNQDPSGAAKWFTAVYHNPTGVYCVDAKVLVKPTAAQGDNLNLYYRAYARKADVFVRTPDDSELGTSQRTAFKDECYAQANLKKIPIQTGTTSCTPDGCVSVSYSTAQGSGGRGFNVAYSRPFVSRAEIRLVNPASVELQTAYLRIVSPDDSLTFGNYQGTASTIPSGSANGNHEFRVKLGGTALPPEFFITVDSTPQLVNPNARVRVEFGDARGPILTEDSFVSITGPGRMIVVETPTELQANIRKDVLVTVRNDIGQPITDARVTLQDAEDTTPLDGHELEIQGDNTKDNGENGIYRFRRVKPTSIGFIDVIAKREGFADASPPAPITVRATDFLEFEPEEVGIEEDCKIQPLKVRNTLDTRATVHVYYDDCVTLRGAQITTKSGAAGSGNKPISFSIKPKGTKNLQVGPYLPSGACNIHFEAVANGFSTTIASQDVPASNACQPKLPPNALACVSYEDCPTLEDCDCLGTPGQQPATAGEGTFSGKLGTPQSKCPLGGVCSCDQRWKNKYLKRFEDNFFQNLLTQSLFGAPGPRSVADETGLTFTITSSGIELSAGGTSKTLEVTPLVPFNAMAITVKNTASRAETVNFRANCLTFHSLGVGGISKDTQNSFTVSSNDVLTVAAVYPGSPGCLNESITPEGKVKLSLPERKDKDTLKVGIASAFKEVSVTYGVVGTNPSNFAVILSPSSDANIASRVEREKQGAEPVLAINNILSSQVAAKAKPLIIGDQDEIKNGEPKELTLHVKAEGTELQVTSPSEFPITYTRAKTISPVPYEDLTAFDTVGSTVNNRPSDYNACRNGYCINDARDEDISRAIESDLAPYTISTFSKADVASFLKDRFVDASAYALFATGSEMCNDPDFLACNKISNAAACNPITQVQFLCSKTIGDRAWFEKQRQRQYVQAAGISGAQALCRVALIQGIVKAGSLLQAQRFAQVNPFMEYQFQGTQGLSPYPYGYFGNFQQPFPQGFNPAFGPGLVPGVPIGGAAPTTEPPNIVEQGVPVLGLEKVEVTVPVRKAGDNSGTQLRSCEVQLSKTGAEAKVLSCQKKVIENFEYQDRTKEGNYEDTAVQTKRPTLPTLNKYRFVNATDSLQVFDTIKAKLGDRMPKDGPTLTVYSCVYNWKCRPASTGEIADERNNVLAKLVLGTAEFLYLDKVANALSALDRWFSSDPAKAPKTLDALLKPGGSIAGQQYYCVAEPNEAEPECKKIIASTPFILKDGIITETEKVRIFGTEKTGDAQKVGAGIAVIYAGSNTLRAAVRPALTIDSRNKILQVNNTDPLRSDVTELMTYLMDDSYKPGRLSDCSRFYKDNTQIQEFCPSNIVKAEDFPELVENESAITGPPPSGLAAAPTTCTFTVLPASTDRKYFHFRLDLSQPITDAQFQNIKNESDRIRSLGKTAPLQLAILAPVLSADKKSITAGLSINNKPTLAGTWAYALDLQEFNPSAKLNKIVGDNGGATNLTDAIPLENVKVTLPLDTSTNIVCANPTRSTSAGAITPPPTTPPKPAPLTCNILSISGSGLNTAFSMTFSNATTPNIVLLNAYNITNPSSRYTNIPPEPAPTLSPDRKGLTGTFPAQFQTGWVYNITIITPIGEASCAYTVASANRGLKLKNAEGLSIAPFKSCDVTITPGVTDQKIDVEFGNVQNGTLELFFRKNGGSDQGPYTYPSITTDSFNTNINLGLGRAYFVAGDRLLATFKPVGSSSSITCSAESVQNLITS